jgi:hypothetical protein
VTPAGLILVSGVVDWAMLSLALSRYP